MLKTKTFASYQAKEGWQKKLLQLVQDYARCSGGEWLVLAGSPGAGKTHLCTAVCGAALEQGEDVRQGSLDASRLTAVTWITKIRKLFPKETVEVLERHLTLYQEHLKKMQAVYPHYFQSKA